MYQSERILMGEGDGFNMWDPRKEDYQDHRFNSYNEGPGRDLHRSLGLSGGVVTLYVQNLPFDITEDGLRNIFLASGNVLRAVTKVSKIGDSACIYGFVDMQNLRDAEDAIRRFNGFVIGEHRLKVQIALSAEEKERRRIKKNEEEEFLSSLHCGHPPGPHLSDTEDVRHRLSIKGASGKPGRGRGRGDLLDELTDNETDVPGRVRRAPLIADPPMSYPSMSGGVGFPYHNSPFYGRGRGYNNYGPHMARGRGDPYGYMPSYGGYSGMGDMGPYSSYRPGMGRGHHYRGPQTAYRQGDNYSVLGHVRPMMGRGLSMYQRDASVYPSKRDSTGAGNKVKVTPGRRCLNCSRPGELQCSRCKMPYCSEDCQRRHWVEHKRDCKALREMQNMTPDELEGQFEVVVDDEFFADVKRAESNRRPGSSSGSSKGRSSGGRGGKSGRKQAEKTPPPQSGGQKAKASVVDSQVSAPSGGVRRKQTSPGGQKQSPPDKSQLKAKQPGGEASCRNGVDSRRFLFKDMSTVKLVVGAAIQVLVTHVEHPAKIFVQPWVLKELERFEELNDQINKLCEGKVEAVTAPIVGNVYGALFKEEGKYYRCVVRTLKAPNTAAVFFFDYGNCTDIQFTELRPLTAEILAHPVQAVECQMSDLSPTGAEWSADCIKFLQTRLPIMNLATFQVDKATGGAYLGHFHLDKEGCSLRDVLIREKLAKSLTSALLTADIPSSTVDLHVGQELVFWVLDVESPSHFLAQILEETRVINFKRLDDELQATFQCKDVPQTPYNPAAGEFVIAQFSQDQKWYRADVVSVSGTKFSLRYIDFGNSELVDASKIRPGSDKFNKLPSQCITCYLHGVSSSDWPADVVTSFKKLLGSGDKKVCVKSKKGTSLGLEVFYDENKPLSQAVLQKLSEFSSSGKGECRTEKLPCDGSVVDVVIYEVDVSSSFFVQKVDAASALYTIMSSLKDSAKKAAYVMPAVGELVGALFPEDREWYRAVVEAVDRSTCSVQFVDYGNCDTVPLKNIRKLDSVASKLPWAAIECHLDGQPQLEQLIPYKNTKVKVKAVSEKGGVYSVVVWTSDEKCLNKLADESVASSSVSRAKSPSASAITSATTLPSAISASVTLVGASSTSVSKSAASISKVRKGLTVQDVVYSAPADGKCLVNVTNVVNPQLLYCQVAESEAIQALDILTSNMTKYSKEPSTVKVIDPQINDLCIVCIRDSWYRGFLQETGKFAVRVQLLDYGVVEEATLSDLRPMQPEFLELKCLALKCALHGICPTGGSWSSNAIETLKRIERRTLMLVIKERVDDMFYIKLCDQGDDQTEVSDLLVGEGFAQPVGGPPTMDSPPGRPTPSPPGRPPIVSSRMPKSTMPANGSEIDAIAAHVEDLDQIYVQLIPGAISLNELQPEMNAACDGDDSNILPGKGEVVCAKFEGVWYRARVDAVHETNVRIFFVDYGNYDNVPFTAIKKLDSRFSQLAMQAIHCTLAGVDIKGNPSQIQRLRELLANVKLVIKVLGVKQDVFQVQINASDQIVNDLFKDLETGSPATGQTSLGCASFPLDGTPTEAVTTDVQGFSAITLQTMQGFHAVNELMGELNSHPGEAEEKAVPRVGDLVAAVFSVDNIWYRARVTDVSDSSCTVLFIDHGNKDQLIFSQIRKLDEEFLKLPSQGIKCSLNGAENIDDPVLLEKLKESISSVPLLVKVMGKHEDVYSIQIEINGKNINDTFCVGARVDHSTKTTAQRTDVAPLKSAVVSVDGSSFDAVATHIEGFHKMYIQTITGCEVLLEMMSEMNAHCNKTDASLTPAVGDFICALFREDQTWYRARVESVDGEKCKVFFVDFGNEDNVSFSNTRKLEGQFRHMPIQGICCMLDGVDISDDAEQLQLLQEKITNVKLTVTLKQKLGDTHPAEMFVDEENINEFFRKDRKCTAKSTMNESEVTFADLPVDGSTVEVVAVHVQEFDAVYVRAVGSEAKLDALMQEMNIQCAASGVAVQPTAGDVVSAPSNMDGVRYRAVVDKVSDKNCTVTFMDYGNSETIPVKGVMKLESQFRKLPFQGIRCALDRVTIGGNTEKLVDLAKMIADVKLSLKVVKRDNDKYIVQISIGNNNINDHFKTVTSAPVDTLSATPAPVDTLSATRSVKLAAETCSVELPTDGSFVDTVPTDIQDFDAIYIQTVEGGTALLSLMEELNAQCKATREPVQPSVGDLVCTLYQQDDTWYRARVQAVQGANFTVFFCDYGNSETVEVTSFRRLDPKFCKFPLQAVRCSLAGVDVRNNPPELLKLMDNIANVKLTVKVLSVSNGVHMVEMYVDDGKKNINDLFKPVVEEDEEEAAIRRQIEELQLKLASKTAKK